MLPFHLISDEKALKDVKVNVRIHSMQFIYSITKCKSVSLILVFYVLEIRNILLLSYFSLKQWKVSCGVAASCVVLHDYVQYVTVVRARPDRSCTVGGTCRFPCERVSGELSGYTKPFTPMACGRDSSHGLSEPGPLHLSTHPL